MIITVVVMTSIITASIIIITITIIMLFYRDKILHARNRHLINHVSTVCKLSVVVASTWKEASAILCKLSRLSWETPWRALAEN